MKPFKPATTVSPSSAHPTQHLCVALSTCLFQVQSAVLRAAAEGRWEAIQQAFHLPDQKPLVLGARNEVSWAAQLTSSSPYIIPMCTLSSFLFNVVWVDSPSFCGPQWAPSPGQAADYSDPAASGPAEQGKVVLHVCV